MTQLIAFLNRHRRVALDTSIFIYQLEANTKYLALTDTIFTWLERPGSRAIASTISMTELLVQPYRRLDVNRAGSFYALLSTFPNLDWIAPDLQIAALAARIRADHGLKTPDAIQAATAAHAGVPALVTNDSIFERVTDFETLILDRFL